MPKLMFAVQTASNSETPELRIWSTLFAMRLSNYKDFAGQPLELCNVNTPRIMLARNKIVVRARDAGCDYILMVDPDMLPDRYVPEGGVPFWDAAWSFMRQHNGPCVCAAPYCGGQGEQPVHVFGKDSVTRDITRVGRYQASTMDGWVDVEAVGTGLMLIDMRVFDVLDKDLDEHGDHKPHFDDVYTDSTKTELKYSQDVFFCNRCRENGVPIYVNFDCWAGHRQSVIIERPRREDYETQATDRREPAGTTGVVEDAVRDEAVDPCGSPTVAELAGTA